MFSCERCVAAHALVRDSSTHAASTRFALARRMRLGAEQVFRPTHCHGRRAVQALAKGGGEYEQFYKVELEERKAASRKAAEEQAAADMKRVEADIAAGTHGKVEVLMRGLEGRGKGADQEPL
jgi:hypothetical protein